MRQKELVEVMRNKKSKNREVNDSWNALERWIDGHANTTGACHGTPCMLWDEKIASQTSISSTHHA